MPDSAISGSSARRETGKIPPPVQTRRINPAADHRKIRRIIAEDHEWSLATVPQLTELCLQHIIKNFENNPILEKLLPKHKVKVLEKLSPDLPLKVTANLISDEGYWKRCCLKCWAVCDTDNYGGSWKRMFFERHLEGIIENFIPEVTDSSVVLDAIPFCKDYVKKLSISQLLPPVKDAANLVEEDIYDGSSDTSLDLPSIDHFDFCLITDKLTNLEELQLIYGVKGCGMNFEWNLFEFTLRDCQLLAKAVNACKTLKVLKLNRSKVDDDKVRTIISKLLDHPSLIELDLSHNLIGDRGARAVGKLINRSKLKYINLCDNKLKAHGAQAIAFALTKNATLISLNLRLNKLGDEGGQAIAHALLKNSTLADIHLGSNELTEPTAAVFSQVLSQNTGLKCINLSCNKIGPDGGQQLQEGMLDNKTVVNFDLRLTDVGQESEFCINQCLKNNQERLRKNTN
ncbi:dynein regulatory complex subunit 5 [Protopterus annectens]|uniref:dynein regulatory complex subunit 5 n=1 Tax=Protopterus annectens TaxID=7888 RepID=UPI001CFBF608|nr:dynein regulatory complex subunit 5 [Protopterus annectens]